MSVMGWLGEKLGTTNTFKATAPTNAFKAKEAQLAQSQYGGTISDAQRAALAGPGQANQTAGMQSGLAQALMDQAAGKGPSLAQNQLRRATEANIAQGAGAIASQRGINPALATRLVSQNQASASQMAAGQSAELAAQEQLNARGLLAQALSAQRGQDIGQQQANTSLLSTAGGLQQGQNAVNLQNSLGVQGLNQSTAAQNANLNLGAQQINAGVAAQNATTNAGLVGGLLSGAGAAATGGATAGAACGGEIPTRERLASALSRRRYASGGEIEIPDVRIPDYGGGAGARSLATGLAAAGEGVRSLRKGKAKGIAKEPEDLTPPPPLPEMMARGGRVPAREVEIEVAEPRRRPAPPPDYGTKREAELPDLRLDTYQGENVRRTHGVPFTDRERFARGGSVPEPRGAPPADRRRKAPEPDMGRKREVELPDLRLDTYQGENIRRAHGVPLAERYATGGRVDVHDFRGGGRVPGRARFPGDTPANDTVPALVSPGEIVLPRTVVQHPEAEDRAADFVAAIRRQKQGAPGSYGEMLARMRQIDAMADGGEVEEPGLWSRVKRWAGAREGDESAEASRDVAEGINAALPEDLSGRGGVMERRRRLAQMDRDIQ